MPRTKAEKRIAVIVPPDRTECGGGTEYILLVPHAVDEQSRDGQPLPREDAVDCLLLPECVIGRVRHPTRQRLRLATVAHIGAGILETSASKPSFSKAPPIVSPFPRCTKASYESGCAALPMSVALKTRTRVTS